MRRGRALVVAMAAAFAGAFACGDVPTLPGGVAFITPVQLPSPSVAFGDTLRDSAGNAAPLRVVATARDGTTITDVVVHYVLTSLNSGASIDERGFLRAPDSLGTLRLVAQVTDGTSSSGLQLQTPEVSIDVVPLADSIAASGTRADSVSAPFVQPLQVTISGLGPTGTRAGVGGIRVHYRIVTAYPAAVPIAGRFYLSDEQGVTQRPDSTISVDTTSSSGVASRSLVGPDVGGTKADSVLVEATAFSQAHGALRGGPVRFMVRFKRS